MKADHVGLGIAVILTSTRLGLDLVESLLVSNSWTIERLPSAPSTVS
jgi:hypothetical protein